MQPGTGTDQTPTPERSECDPPRETECDPPRGTDDDQGRGEERYRLLLESVKDYAIFMLDPQGHIVTWNVGAERIKGYTAAEIIGSHFTRFYPPEDLGTGKWEHELQTAAAEGRFEYEGWRLRKDGSRFWANVVLTALRDHDGRLRGFAKVTRDLTARVQAEEQARQLARAEAARAEAEAASRAKDEFLAMLAHELRNPLAPLVNGLELLRCAGNDPETREQARVMMDRQTRHLRRIVDDLLAVARLSRGRIRLDRDRLDLAQLVRQVAGDHRPAAEQAGLALTVEAPDTPVWVDGDEARLTQVVANLLDNAVRFTEPGGRVGLAVAANRGADEAVLTVSDSGVGLDADLLGRLFEPFGQGEQSLSRSRGGLGLGLALVRGLVELHGGQVSAASPGVNQGSVFTVRLPLLAEPTPLADGKPPPARTASGRKVLVIEDNRDAADTLRTFLEMVGHDARVAYTGPEGVRTATEWLPDLVVSDIGLPGLDGYEVARQLRRLPALRGAHLVALTGYDGPEPRRRSREAGFDLHLVKPADPQEILNILESVNGG